MITFRDKLQNLNGLIEGMLDRENIYISDLIELKKRCDIVSEEIDSKYDDVRVDLN